MALMESDWWVGFLGGDFIICISMVQKILNVKKNHNWNYFYLFFVSQLGSTFKVLFTLGVVIRHVHTLAISKSHTNSL
jgi:hypothetical protein